MLSGNLSLLFFVGHQLFIVVADAPRIQHSLALLDGGAAPGARFFFIGSSFGMSFWQHIVCQIGYG